MTHIRGFARGLVLGVLSLGTAFGQTETPTGPDVSAEELSPTQWRLVEDWVARFRDVTGQDVDARYFYERFVRLSTKTTFTAVTHALGRTALTGASGEPLGSAIDLIEHLESVHGKIRGAPGDEQFRAYVILRADAVETLEASREFERGPDNTVFHKGYPRSYRQQGGAPSIQISVARDGRHADIDVDYRSSSFPGALLNGHLTAANSDVRAGNNYDRHNGRWAGFVNWWRGFFGLSLRSSYEGDEIVDTSLALPEVPRAGRQTIEKMHEDFLRAWLVEGNVIAAMSYISRRAYPCVAVNQGLDWENFDRGMAPYRLLMGMRLVKEALGPIESLEKATVGVRLNERGYRIVRQPHHAQFVLHAVPNEIASKADCTDPESLEAAPRRAASQDYGEYFLSAFYLASPTGKSETVALLWAQEDGYWKIVAYEVEPHAEPEVTAAAPADDVAVPVVAAIPELERTVDAFLDAWLVEKSYDRAYSYLSRRTSACYNLFRQDGSPEATTDEEAARGIRAGMERLGESLARRASLAEFVEPVMPVSDAAHLVEHERRDSYALVSLPNAVLDLADCSRRTRGEAIGELRPASSSVPDPNGYGTAFGSFLRFRTPEGDAPVLRLLWMRENEGSAEAFRVVAYDVEVP